MTEPGAGRYAPSPSGDLHLGNLRTALLAWAFARRANKRFLLRVEDLDRVRPGAQQRQLDDLAAIGLDWDEPVVNQTARLPTYQAAIDRLTVAGLTYECYCTRREIQQASSAPHGPLGAYPGTCRALDERERDELRAQGRRPAIRLRSRRTEFEIHDELHGRYRGMVDDVVLRRGDGIPAYNLAVVVDDAAYGIDQVVRGDDLLSSAPRQAYLASLLDLPVPRYAHVPLVLNAEGRRLAKRDGAVTLADQRALGATPTQVVRTLAHSLWVEANSAAEFLDRFDPVRLPREPWVLERNGLLQSNQCP